MFIWTFQGVVQAVILAGVLMFVICIGLALLAAEIKRKWRARRNRKKEEERRKGQGFIF